MAPGRAVLWARDRGSRTGPQAQKGPHLASWESLIVFSKGPCVFTLHGALQIMRLILVPGTLSCHNTLRPRSPAWPSLTSRPRWTGPGATPGSQWPTALSAPTAAPSTQKAGIPTRQGVLAGTWEQAPGTAWVYPPARLQPGLGLCSSTFGSVLPPGTGQACGCALSHC